MKFLCQSMALVLIVLLLAGCSVQTTPSSSEATMPTETEINQEAIDKLKEKYGLESPLPSATEHNEEVLSVIDTILDGENVQLQCWLSIGSGPTTIALNDYKEDIYNLFASRNWVRQNADVGWEQNSAHWVLFLNSGANVNIAANTATPWIQVMERTSEGTSSTWYSTTESLTFALTELYPGPEARFLLTTVSADLETPWEELIQTYAASFEESWLASGHITELEVTRLELTDPKKHGESLYPFFHLAFSVTPADPSAPYWAGQTAGSDGRYSYDLLFHLLPDEEPVWRCDWFRAPPKNS